MDPLNPFGGQDLFVRFDDTGAVLQSTVLGEFRRGLGLPSSTSPGKAA